MLTWLILIHYNKKEPISVPFIYFLLKSFLILSNNDGFDSQVFLNIVFESSCVLLFKKDKNAESNLSPEIIPSFAKER